MMMSILFLMGKQLFFMPHLTSVWEILMRFITRLAEPWCSLFWFCLRAYMLLWTGISYISMKILFVPIQIYKSTLREYKVRVMVFFNGSLFSILISLKITYFLIISPIPMPIFMRVLSHRQYPTSTFQISCCDLLMFLLICNKLKTGSHCQL